MTNLYTKIVFPYHNERRAKTRYKLSLLSVANYFSVKPTDLDVASLISPVIRTFN